MSSTLPTPAASPTHVASSLPTSPRPSKIRPAPAPTVKLSDPNTPRYILLPVSRLPNYTPAVSSKSISQALSALNDSSGGGGAGHRSPRSKHSVSKLTRNSRSPAVSLSAIDILASIPSASSAALPNNATSTSLKSTTASPPGSIRNDVFGVTDEPKPPAWIQEVVGNFEIVEDSVAVAGFQLYAVEKCDSTREKFVQIYHFPETIAQHATSSRIGTASHSTHGHSASLQGSSAFLNPKGGTSPNQRSGKDSARSSHLEPAPTLQTTVLNLIKIVRSALSLFGLFDIAEEERDGLLCDTTVDGIRKCIDVIGKFVDVEPTERVLDPSVLAAILSVIISTRNKLHCLGIGHTKDPFLEPTAFMEALITFQRTQFKQHHHSSSTASTSSVQSPHHHKIKITPYLSAELIQRINSVYAAKVRAPEPYKVHRVIKHKIDDSIALASNLSESLTSNIRNPLGLAGVSDDRDGNLERPMHVPGLGTLDTPVTDLEILARMIVASGSTGKEGAGTVDSLRYVWTGKKNAGIREKERKERGKEMIEVQKERARDRERTEAAKRRDTIDGKQMKSDGEEGGSGFGVPGLLWKGKLFGS
ncbi:hypothetical protein FRC00_002260, partial [Tulasnella sp. 408]